MKVTGAIERPKRKTEGGAQAGRPCGRRRNKPRNQGSTELGACFSVRSKQHVGGSPNSVMGHHRPCFQHTGNTGGGQRGKFCSSREKGKCYAKCNKNHRTKHGRPSRGIGSSRGVFKVT